MLTFTNQEWRALIRDYGLSTEAALVLGLMLRGDEPSALENQAMDALVDDDFPRINEAMAELSERQVQNG